MSKLAVWTGVYFNGNVSMKSKKKLKLQVQMKMYIAIWKMNLDTI